MCSTLTCLCPHVYGPGIVSWKPLPNLRLEPVVQLVNCLPRLAQAWAVYVESEDEEEEGLKEDEEMMEKEGQGMAEQMVDEDGEYDEDEEYDEEDNHDEDSDDVEDSDEVEDEVVTSSPKKYSRLSLVTDADGSTMPQRQSGIYCSMCLMLPISLKILLRSHTSAMCDRVAELRHHGNSCCHCTWYIKMWQGQ